MTIMPPSRLPGDRWLRPEWNRCLDALSALWNRLGPEGTAVTLTALLAASGDEEENEPAEVAVTLPAAALAALSQLVSLLTHRPEYGGVNAEVPSG